MTGWRPVIIFILNFIIGAGVAWGIVPVEHKDWLVESLAEIVGYVIILITSIAAIIHALKHPTSKPVVNIYPPTSSDTQVTTPLPVSPVQESYTESNSSQELG